MPSRFRLARAYRSVFATGEGQMVLADLARHSGFYRITERGASEVIQYNEGMRATFWRIFSMLRLTHADMTRLAREARETHNQDEVDDD